MLSKGRQQSTKVEAETQHEMPSLSLFHAGFVLPACYTDAPYAKSGYKAINRPLILFDLENLISCSLEDLLP